MTRRLAGPVLFAIFAVAISGCTRLGTEAEGPPDAGGSPAASPGSTKWAANAGEVARFADEVPFGPEAITVSDKTPVRQSPGGGEIIATLPAGEGVTKLSAHGTEALVCFDEPKDHRHLVGWVAQSALQDSAPPPTPPAADEEDAAPPQPDPPQRPPGHHHRHGRKPPHH
jgi:hypothetical protein